MLARVRSNLAFRDLWWAAVENGTDSITGLEDAFARRFGFPHALMFPYGRSALHTLALALQLQGREVVCPAYTCAEVPYSISCAGATVRLVDSAADHFLPGAAEWAAAVSPHSAMAIITSLFGYPVDPKCEEVVRLTVPDAFILYDESHGYGVQDAGGLQARKADAVLFSLGLGKILTALSGGMLLLRNPQVYRVVKRIRDTQYTVPGAVHTVKLLVKGVTVWLAFREPAITILDYLARWFGLLPTQAQDWTPTAEPQLPIDGEILVSPYQAKVGRRQFACLEAVIAARRKIGEHYDRRLREEGFNTFAHATTPTWPRYPWAVADRDSIVSGLRRYGIQVSLFLPYSCAKLSAYRDLEHACPNADVWAHRMINLPNWPSLEIEQAERVVRAVTQLRARQSNSVAAPCEV